MAVLIIAEHNNHTLNSATLNAIGAAKQLTRHEGGVPLHVLIAGSDCQAVAGEAAAVAGVDRVLLVDNPAYQHRLAHSVGNLCAELTQKQESGYSHLVCAATVAGKDLMPRVAALLDVAQISDISEVISADTFVRPVYAGSALATVQSLDPIKVITVRVSAFDAVTEQADSAAEIETLSLQSEPATGTTDFVDEQLTVSERPELTSARVVVSGGRGVGSSDDFALIETLADKLGGAIGATRAAVDAGFVPNDLQVGQTGKIVAPDLYIAVGLSGAIQHVAGMKDSRVIVAINNDPDAPIFEQADYGLVADLFEAVPQMTQQL